MKCIIHIGAGKCGSSSLQSALSHRTSFTAFDSTIYEYMSIASGGQLLRGEVLMQMATLEPLGYMPTYGLVENWIDNIDYRQTLIAEFKKVADENIVPIFSWENWINQSHLFNKYEILSQLGLDAIIVMFIRPQVGWHNSAWWQWGAWGKLDFDEWLETESKYSGIVWGDLIRLWQSVPGVAKLYVYPITRNVVTTFFQLLKAPTPIVESSNATLDLQILRFYQRNREFRPDSETPGNDFILERCLPPVDGGVPWVIPHAKIAQLIERYRDSNEQLLSLLPVQERDAIQSDPHWWDANAYRDRQVVSPVLYTVTVEEAESLARRAIRGLVTLDERLRRLQWKTNASKPSAHTPTEVDNQIQISRAREIDLERELAANVAANLSLQQTARDLEAQIQSIQIRAQHLENDLATERGKLLPHWFRKTISTNGLRRLINACVRAE